MGIAKIVIAFIAIGTMEMITKFEDKWDTRTFEISMSILFAAWIISGAW